ncbi:hypothetical protein A2U01_0060574, partial [Trifolium medium]|nr:hypothetical protein [Trifolium medium]
RTTIRKKRKIEKDNTSSNTKGVTGEDLIDGAQNEEHKENSQPTPPSSEIVPESPVAAKESSMKDAIEDVPTSTIEGDQNVNVTQDVVTSTTEESSKKAVEKDHLTSGSKENTTTKTQQSEEDP